MTTEELEAEVKRLTTDNEAKDGEIAEFKKNAGKVQSEEDLKKLEQKAYNQGFDKAKNQFEADKKDFVNKEDVTKMLADKDKLFANKTTLMGLGVKSPDKALKIIDEADLLTFGTDEFKADDFKTKYADIIVFGKGENPPHTPLTKDNKKGENDKITADNYGDLTPSQKEKLSSEDKLALLKE